MLHLYLFYIWIDTLKSFVFRIYEFDRPKNEYRAGLQDLVWIRKQLYPSPNHNFMVWGKTLGLDNRKSFAFSAFGNVGVLGCRRLRYKKVSCPHHSGGGVIYLASQIYQLYQWNQYRSTFAMVNWRKYRLYSWPKNKKENVSHTDSGKAEYLLNQRMEDFIKKRRKILQKQKKLRHLCLPQLLYYSPLNAFFNFSQRSCRAAWFILLEASNSYSKFFSISFLIIRQNSTYFLILRLYNNSTGTP